MVYKVLNSADPVESGQLAFFQRSKSKTRSPLKYKAKETLFSVSLFGEPGGIRTHDLLIRSQTLYPAELRAHMLFDSSDILAQAGGRVKCFFDMMPTYIVYYLLIFLTMRYQCERGFTED